MAIENTHLDDDQLKRLTALLDLESGLSRFEVDFIESISHQNFALTERQQNKLDEIYGEHILGRRRARR